MSEDIKIHHSSQAPNEANVTDDWTKVTCGGCRLEQPLFPLPEYRVPADVLQRDALLVALDRLTAAAQGVREALAGSGQGAAPVGLSEAAVEVLKSVPGSTMGMTPARGVSASVRDELRAAGMIGSAGGLTQRGSIWKERQDSSSLDALFGPE